jgi:hypothetical protein
MRAERVKERVSKFRVASVVSAIRLIFFGYFAMILADRSASPNQRK